jgi:hypothetical protein
MASRSGSVENFNVSVRHGCRYESRPSNGQRRRVRRQLSLARPGQGHAARLDQAPHPTAKRQSGAVSPDRRRGVSTGSSRASSSTPPTCSTTSCAIDRTRGCGRRRPPVPRQWGAPDQDRPSRTGQGQRVSPVRREIAQRTRRARLTRSDGTGPFAAAGPAGHTRRALPTGSTRRLSLVPYPRTTPSNGPVSARPRDRRHGRASRVQPGRVPRPARPAARSGCGERRVAARRLVRRSTHRPDAAS